MKFLSATSSIFLLSLLVACSSEPAKPQLTSLEIQAIQAKNFDVDKKTSFDSSLSVLQDLGYIIGSASFETGFITAQSPAKGTSGSIFFVGVLPIPISGSEQKTVVTVAVESLGPKKSRVRLNFVDKSHGPGMFGSGDNDKPILDPVVYQNAFDKISETVFIKTAQK